MVMHLPGGVSFPPRFLRNYEPHAVVGAGNQGTVIQAEQRSLSRAVAVKFISISGELGADQRARFAAEARIAALLSHPNVVRVIDYDMDEDPAWIVYEFVPGRGLHVALKSASIPFPQALTVIAQVAGALELAHSQGVFHRDVKLENVLELAPGQYKLADFGIAKWQAARVQTEAGLIMGTPTYLAPELILGEPAGAASDLYALGVLFYELLTGRPPFSDDDVGHLLHQQLKATPVPPRELCPQLSTEVEDLVLEMLAKVPAQRPAGAGVVRQRCERLELLAPLPQTVQVQAKTIAHPRPALPISQTVRVTPPSSGKRGVMWAATLLLILFLGNRLARPTFQPIPEAERISQGMTSLLSVIQRVGPRIGEADPKAAPLQAAVLELKAKCLDEPRFERLLSELLSDAKRTDWVERTSYAAHQLALRFQLRTILNALAEVQQERHPANPGWLRDRLSRRPVPPELLSSLHRWFDGLRKHWREVGLSEADLPRRAMLELAEGYYGMHFQLEVHKLSTHLDVEWNRIPQEREPLVQDSWVIFREFWYFCANDRPIREPAELRAKMEVVRRNAAGPLQGQARILRMCLLAKNAKYVEHLLRGVGYRLIRQRRRFNWTVLDGEAERAILAEFDGIVDQATIGPRLAKDYTGFSGPQVDPEYSIWLKAWYQSRTATNLAMRLSRQLATGNLRGVAQRAITERRAFYQALLEYSRWVELDPKHRGMSFAPLCEEIYALESYFGELPREFQLDLRQELADERATWTLPPSPIFEMFIAPLDCQASRTSMNDGVADARWLSSFRAGIARTPAMAEWVGGCWRLLARHLISRSIVRRRQRRWSERAWLTENGTKTVAAARSHIEKVIQQERAEEEFYAGMENVFAVLKPWCGDDTDMQILRCTVKIYRACQAARLHELFKLQRIDDANAARLSVDGAGSFIPMLEENTEHRDRLVADALSAILAIQQRAVRDDAMPAGMEQLFVATVALAAQGPSSRYLLSIAMASWPGVERWKKDLRKSHTLLGDILATIFTTSWDLGEAKLPAAELRATLLKALAPANPRYHLGAAPKTIAGEMALETRL